MERLCSLLTTLRSVNKKDADSTVAQRSVVYLLAGGWLEETRRKVGLSLTQASLTQDAISRSLPTGLHSAAGPNVLGAHLDLFPHPCPT